MSFEIFELDVGQGVLAISPMPVDVSNIEAWHADAVLTMTEVAEMPTDVSGAMQEASFTWLAFPVTDFGVPDEDAHWRTVEAAVLSLLSKKGRVLVHCKGGCGRSGMAVLRLMIAAGEDPAEAFARLRKVRPCAVETEAQLAWASGASLPWPL